MTVMNDLKEAILNVLNEAADNTQNDYAIVNLNVLRNLQAEFNIYFVEPEDEQVRLV